VQSGTLNAPNDRMADATQSATETIDTAGSKEPVEQFYSGLQKRLVGLPVSQKGHNTNEAHEEEAQLYKAEE
jgi:hypothetical protein